ncbi:hypothetical protein KSP39_PZI019271 [Platanthera zijinensis]|uniref:Uncharacterized protein n=1 Tax=Platanthera zijinensis TaxID=2320716 RepID=A0AAP0FXZ4_9ASPA
MAAVYNLFIINKSGVSSSTRIMGQLREWAQMIACGSRAFGTRCMPSPSSSPPP